MARQSKPLSYLLHRQSGQAMTVVKAPDGRRKLLLLGLYESLLFVVSVGIDPRHLANRPRDPDVHS